MSKYPPSVILRWALYIMSITIPLDLYINLKNFTMRDASIVSIIMLGVTYLLVGFKDKEEPKKGLKNGT